MSDIDLDETPSAAERAEADRLAHALERETTDAEAGSLSAARLLQASRPGLDDEIARARLRRELVRSASRVRSTTRWRAWAPWAAAAVLAVASAAVVRRASAPPSTRALDAREAAARVAVMAVGREDAFTTAWQPDSVTVLERTRDESTAALLGEQRLERMQRAIFYDSSEQGSRPRGVSPTRTATTGGHSS